MAETQTQSLPIDQVNLLQLDDVESLEGPASSGRGRGRGESDSSTSASPRNTSSSWETTMFGLMRELENICSRTSSPHDSVESLTATATPCSTPTTTGEDGGIALQASSSSSSNSRRTCSVATAAGHHHLPPPHQGSLTDGGGSTPPPHPPPPSPLAGAQQLRVRHEETEDQLDRTLTMICHLNSPSSSTWSCDDNNKAAAIVAGGASEKLAGNEEDPRVRKRSMPPAKKSKLRYWNSAKYGLHFRLDLVDRDPDDIAVSINADEHILRVFASGEVIHLVQLAESTTAETMSCVIVDDGRTLYVRQRSKETMYLEHDGSPEVNLPIVRHDESNLTMTINLRIPTTFCPDDIVVKTIDDTLLIKAGCPVVVSNPGGIAATAYHQDEGVCSSSSSSSGVQFRLVMNLPEGTVTRSVCAWMVTGHLIVRGNVGPTIRRMTCNF